jgi:hypothetical protein
MYFQYPQAFPPSFPPPFQPPVNPLLQFLPPAAQQHLAAQQLGRTQYNYRTPDGGVPMEGKVPTGSALDPPKQPQPPFFPLTQGMNCVPGAIHPFVFPNGTSGPINFCGAPPAYSQVPQYTPGVPPTAYQCLPVVSGAPPPAYHCTPVGSAEPQPYGIAKPPPPPAQEFYSTKELEPPVRGNRVKGQLPKFDNGMGYIFPEKNCVLHILKHNVLANKSPVPGSDAVQGQGRYQFNIVQEGFTAQTVPCSMTFEELIKQTSCQDRANHHPPYNQPGQGYPENHIGIQELLPVGDGSYVLGIKITMKSYQAKAQIGEIWPDTVGSAGEQKPKIILRLPV